MRITNIPNTTKMFDRKRNNDNSDMVNKVEMWSPVYWVPVPLS